jgi:hypothetical protein
VHRGRAAPRLAASRPGRGRGRTGEAAPDSAMAGEGKEGGRREEGGAYRAGARARGVEGERDVRGVGERERFGEGVGLTSGPH